MLGHNASLSTASIFANSVFECTCVVNVITFVEHPIHVYLLHCLKLIGSCPYTKY